MCPDVINSDTAILEEDVAVSARGVWNGGDVGPSKVVRTLVKIVLEDADVADSSIKCNDEGKDGLVVNRLMILGCIVEDAGWRDLTWSQRENDCRVGLLSASRLCLKCRNEGGSCCELAYDVRTGGGSIDFVLRSGSKSGGGGGPIGDGLIVDASYLGGGIGSSYSRYSNGLAEVINILLIMVAL